MNLNKYPISMIKGRGFLEIDGSVIVLENIKVASVRTSRTITTSHGGDAGEITESHTHTIKGTPVKYQNITPLFGELALVAGADLPKHVARISMRIDAETWVRWTWNNAIHDTIGSINFGAVAPLGEHGWTCYPDPATGIIVTTETLDAPPAIPTLSSSDKFALRCMAMYGSGASQIVFDTDGASIEISLETEDNKTDRLIVYGKNLTKITVTPKAKPRNISYENWLLLCGLDDTLEVGSYTGSGASPTLVFRGPKAGDFEFTLLSASVKDPSATVSAKEALMDELKWSVDGDSMGDNKLVISTAATDITYAGTEGEGE